jgi:hypothetical protein
MTSKLAEHLAGVECGPAVFPQPRLEARTREGWSPKEPARGLTSPPRAGLAMSAEASGLGC